MKAKIIGVIVFLVLPSFIAIAADYEESYNGRLRVYIVEPLSRWKDKEKRRYSFGFLDFAFDDTLSIKYQDTFTDTIVWNGKDAGFGDVTKGNIMAIAAVFNPQANKGYADPPFGNPFDAYYVDATAAAVPGSIGYNKVTSNFTHTVFVEEGTATWCPYCPAMAKALKNVYESGEYPFYFVALIADKNKKAEKRLRDYNLAGYPTAFFDGGAKVLIGGYKDESYYISRIKSCGRRDVHELNLSIEVEWVGDSTLQIEISITNKEAMGNLPPNAPTIEGPTTGKKGEEYEYTFTVEDPNGDDVYLWVEWGDGSVIEWSGPYKSGESVQFSHKWTEQGTYTIRAKAKDILEEEGEWETLEVSMPRCRERMKYRPFLFFFYIFSLLKGVKDFKTGFL